MKRMFIATLALCFATNTQAVTLPSALTKELSKADIPLSGVAIIVQEINKPTPLIRLNAAQPMNPASTMKLLTTFAALDLLGPAYTWKTEAYLDGELKDGVLDGNLILKGYGDPKFTIEQFWLWLAELRSRGLREIRASVVEISQPAFDFVTRQHDMVHAFNGPILEIALPAASFDLVFTMGVLIHVAPEQLQATMARMVQWSSALHPDGRILQPHAGVPASVLIFGWGIRFSPAGTETIESLVRQLQVKGSNLCLKPKKFLQMNSNTIYETTWYGAILRAFSAAD